MTESPDGRYIFLFGGSDVNGECCNDVFVLNVDRSEWCAPYEKYHHHHTHVHTFPGSSI